MISFRRPTVATFAAASCLALGVAGSGAAYASSATTAAPDVPLSADQRNVAETLESAFEKVADSVGPATVYITARVDMPTGDTEPDGLGNGSPFGDLFGPGGPFSAPGRAMPGRVVQSSGSGVIVRSDGYVLTNDHVVEGARNGEVTVRLSDGTTYTHCKVYKDFRSDLAVVKINSPSPLPFVHFADSDHLHVGQWAIAIGAPYGEENSMTAGIVSALNRKTAIGEGQDARYYPSLIQTDASINPGNSGGPLLNISGQLIGVNVAIESPSGTSAGIGFAIPANIAHGIMDQLISSGKVVRGSLGVIPQDIPIELRHRLGTDQGALVAEVDPGTPADKAGIQVYDVITRVGDHPVTNEVTLREAVSETPPGTTVPIAVLRAGKAISISATIASADTMEANAGPARDETHTANSLGFDGRTLSQEMLNDSQLLQTLDPGTHGVVVMAVTPGSAASDADLQPRMIITMVDGTPIPNVAALNATIRTAKSGDVLLMTVLVYETANTKWNHRAISVTVP